MEDAWESRQLLKNNIRYARVRTKLLNLFSIKMENAWMTRHRLVIRMKVTSIKFLVIMHDLQD